MKYLIFDPRLPGTPLPDAITNNIIEAAKRGKITPEGEKLILVPDKRYGMTDARGIRMMKRTKKSECIPLKALALRK